MGKCKRKVALVYTGAVSLGSFEAGVAYELVKHIREQGSGELDIDVIVGTSAGALTGALTALALVFGLDPRIIEEAWMSVSLEDLLRLNPHDRSILSSSKVEGLISKYISPPQGRCGNPAYQKAVNLVIIVTNLDGLKYEIHRAKDDEFSISAVSYEDALKFRIEPGFTDWERLREAVRASSAYPAAFEPKTITRKSGEFKQLARYNFCDRDGKTFHYSDGGIVNNQPLNKAIEIVSELPAKDPGQEYERIFLVIDPSPPTDHPSWKDYGVLEVVGKAVWTIPRNQTLYKDLQLLEKVNRRIRWKNAFVSTMADLWNVNPIPAEKQHTLNDLCRQVARYKGGVVLGADPAAYLKTEEERIRNAYRNELAKVRDDGFFVKYCFLLEQVAGLRDKHQISVEMIRPHNAEAELTGVIYGNFGGFLDAGFMRHDYNVGRTYGRRWLTKELDLYRGVHYREQPVDPKVRRKVLQMLFDNSVPLLFEEVGPRLFAGKGDIPKDVTGVLTFAGMFVVSLAKYIVRKSIYWTKEIILARPAPPKKNN
ncbi:MAG: hypothetical protein CVV03_08520 [Firmicutes bacterium HGW-Firmicutes-8]|nr:MAG: hypothetical protein CVV03_08520 [Firmicutes bacterium HGW-Firmicutes-8]